jgi:pyruvate,water dikinase
LQARPITALPEPPTALQWRVPPAGRSYLRANVIELLPDPLSPLFATLALPVWGDAIRELVTSLGMPEMFPRPPLLTINGYAYYDFGLSPSGYARLLLHLPRVSRRLSRLLRQASERWSEIARPRYAAAIAAWAGRDLSATRAADLLEAARQLTRAAAEHYLAIQTGIQRWGTVGEAAFTSLYNRLIKHASDPPALTFLLGLDSAPIRAEKSLFDMAAWARIHPELAEYLATASSAAIAAARLGPSAPIATAEIWREFCRRLAAHLDQFGHTVYDLDFAKAVPADDPAPLLQALKFFLTGRARSPYERQVADAAAREQATDALLARLTGWRRALFRRLLAWAQRYGPLREDALADVGLGWPLLRRMLLEIGQRLVAAGALASARDVFWLELHEVETATRALDASEPISDYRAAVAERHVAWERERRATPPVSLPLKGGVRFAGLDWRNWLAARSDQAAGTSIRGIGASPGRVAGIARVLQDPADFGQMQPGDILVAKITTPAWTPLFALAAAVATDVGGPLSHSSIVAREYHIPAVLGTGVATERIRSGQRITVDGDAGVVTIDA